MAKIQTFRSGRVSGRKRGQWWQLRYSVNGQRVEEHVHSTSINKARDRAAEIEQILSTGSAAEIDALHQLEPMTVAEFVVEFEERYRGWSDNTWRGVRSIRRAVVAQWGALPLGRLTPRMIDGYLASKLDAPDKASGRITNGTANRYRAYLSRLYKQAMRWGRATHNPASKAAAYPEEETPVHALTPEQVDALMDEVRPHAIPWIILGADTGLRRSELGALRWEDIDMEQRTILVRHRKARKPTLLTMTRRVYEQLVALQAAQDSGKVHSLYVLPRNAQGRPIDIRRTLAGAGQRAGIGHVHLHMLRHTFATQALDDGAELYDVQAALGHTTSKTTQRYDHGRSQRARRVTDALDAARQQREAKGAANEAH